MKRPGCVWRTCPADVLLDPAQTMSERLGASLIHRRESRTSTTSSTFDVRIGPKSKLEGGLRRSDELTWLRVAAIPGHSAGGSGPIII